MIEKKISAQHVKRLSGLNFYPIHDEAVNELALALQVSETDAIAKATVDQCLELCTDCPKPAEIRRLAYQKNEQLHPDPTPEEQWGGAPSLCRKCRGWGTKREPPNAVFCECEYGQKIRNDPRIGEKYLALVNKDRVTGNVARLAQEQPNLSREHREELEKLV